MAISHLHTVTRSALALAVILLACMSPLQAQPPSGLPPAVLIENLQSRQAAVAARQDIEAATRARIDDTYKRAIDELKRAATLRSEIAALRKAMVDAPAQIAQLEKRLEAEQPRGVQPDPLPPVDALGTDEVVQRVTDARLARDEAQPQVDGLARAAAESDQQLLASLASRDDVQASLTRLRAEPRGAVPLSTPLGEAVDALRGARIEALQAQLEWLDRKAANQPASAQITQLRLELARIDLARRQAALNGWLDALSARRQRDVEAARAQAARAEAQLGKHAAVVPTLIAQNAELGARLAEVTAGLDRARRELSQLRLGAADIDADLSGVERSAAPTTLSDDTAEELIRRIGALPTAERFSAARAARGAQLQAMTDANREVQREIEGLADLPAAAAASLAGAPIGQAQRAALQAEAVAELSRRRALLLRINDQQRTLIQTLRQTGVAEEALLARAVTARTELLGQLLWVPLERLSLATFTGLRESFDWMLSGAHWRQVYEALATQVQRWPLRVALALLAIIAMYGLRGRWKRRLAALAPAAVSVENYRIGHTLQALLLTLLLAAPGALVLNLVGAGLSYAPNASQFARACADAFAYTGFTFLAMYGFSWLFDARGVAVKHFQWQAEAMVTLQRLIRRFMLVYVPLVFVAVANGRYAPFVNRESLGRLAFILAMLSLATFFWILFRRASPIGRQLMPEDASGWAARLRPSFLALTLLIPLGLAVLSAIGFYPAAIALFELVKRTLLVILAAVIVYGLVAMWVLVQRARLARRQAIAAGPDSQQPRVADEGAQPAPTMQLDITAIGDQSRRLLNMVATAVLFGGLWLIWRNALPLFDVFGELAIWHYTETIDGEQVSGAVTLATLALTAVILIVTAIATRNIGAVLDMVLLQRLELRKDATYAIKTVSRYVIIGVGLVLASNALHIGWDRLQWLVAALGIGLGFGLQEIVANFVSGLIVLGERPIRIGDVVTVGDTTGTVTRIRARATVVTDWDNKEIMIPNKAFITERVINWTLSSQTTRLLIKVGVAYGSDTVKTRRVILDAVTAIPEILKDPSPSVFFVGFGDSSLDFEIRAFVGAFDKRLPTLHAVHTAVEQALRAHGIEIPFPQRDLHIRSADGLAAVLPKPPAAGSAGSRIP